jgi:PAS domain S-box-containing protein
VRGNVESHEGGSGHIGMSGRQIFCSAFLPIRRSGRTKVQRFRNGSACRTKQFVGSEAFVMKSTANVQRYGMAVIACAIAFAVAWLTGAQSSCLFLAVMVSGLYGGKGPGLLSVGLSTLAFNTLISWLPQLPLAAAPSRDLRFGAFVGAALLVNHLISIKRRSDEARRESDQYFGIVAEAATDAILSFDENKQIVFANEAARKIFGWSVSDLTGRPLSMVMKEFPRDGTSTITEVVGLRSDGTEFPAEVSFAEVVRAGRRNITGFVRDISERRQAQAVLRKSESYLAEAQKLSHTGSFGLNVVTGEIFWSEETYRIAGLEVETKPTLEMVLKLVHPDDRLHVQETLDFAIQSETKWDIEHRFLMPDGSVKYMHVVARPVRSGLSQIEYIGAVTDITATKRAEEELRSSEEKYRELIDLSPDAIYVVDETGNVISTNRCGLEMLKCSAEEISGLDVAETYLPKDRAAYLERLQQRRSGRTLRYERIFVRRDGTTIPVEVSISPIRHGCYQAVVRDISERKQAQEALQRSEFYLAEAEKLSHTASWAYDLLRQRFIYWSAELFRLERRDPTQPLPPLEELSKGFTPEDWATLMGKWAESIKERKNFTLETRRTFPDGSIQNLRVEGHPLVNAVGDVVEMMGMTMDITEQSRARAALKDAFDAIQRSEDQLRLIIDTIPALAWSTASDGSLEFVNRRWREYTGLSIEEVRGTGWKAAIYPDDLAQLLEVWSATLISGRPSEYEARLRRFDGEYRWFLFRTVPLHDEHGNVVKWYGTNTDIEDRKLAEEAVRESEHNLSLIIDTIPALVWCALPDGKLEYVNQRIVDYLGVPVSDLTEHGWANFLHPDDLEPTLRSWFHAVATGIRHEVEYRMRCSDGAYRWFHVLGQPLRNHEGRIVRWYGLLADIEDRKHVAETLRRTQGRLSQAMQIATIGEFAASIAHEVNQPLAAVVMNGHACLRWLQAQPPNLTEANQAAERIIRNGNGAAEVVRRIRALFKRSEPEKVPLDLNEVIAEVVHLLTGDILRQGVAVEVDLVEELPPVMADRLQLQQVIFNLLQNGIEAMDKLAAHPKKLVIRSKRQDTAILIEIRDYGPGLNDYDKPFESFYTTKESGMGMGLAICRSILNAHHGRLWAKPTEGPGVTFCLTLPLNADAPVFSPAISSSSS